VFAQHAHDTTVRVQLADADSPTHNRKPRRIAGAAIFCCLGDEPAAEAGPWRFVCNTTRTRFDVTLDAADVPRHCSVWIVARWFNSRGQLGPPSQPARSYILGGTPLLATGARAV